MSTTQNFSSNLKPKVTILTSTERNINQQMLKQYDKQCDEVSEIQQIEFEQSLIVARMAQLDAQKERLKNILNALQSLDSEGGDDDGDDELSDQTS